MKNIITKKIIILNILILIFNNLFSQSDIDFKLLVAANANNDTLIINLLSKGANPNATTADGITSLMYAAEKGNLNICKKLIDAGADVNLKPKWGSSALIAATQYNHLEIVELLILNKAKYNIKDDIDYNALSYAVAYGFASIAETLLFYGASPLIKCNDSYPIMIASFYGDTLMLKILTTYKANLNVKDDKGFTPLMIATQNNSLEAVKFLYENGANINEINVLNQSALSLAVINNNKEITEYLISKSANINQKDKYNLTPLSYSIINQNNKISKLLNKSKAKSPVILFFDNINFTFTNAFGLRDYMIGGQIGLHELRTNLNIFGGITGRPFKKSVLFQENENLFYQYKEKRNDVFVGLEKNINLHKISDFEYFGLSVGLKGIYSYGSYAGTYKKITTNYLFSPYIGCFVKGKYFATNLNYEYIKYTEFQNPSKITLNCSVNFNLLKINYLKKTLFWF